MDAIGLSGALVWSAFAAGLALYAKLMAVWIVGPFVVMLADAGSCTRMRDAAWATHRPRA